MKHKFSLIWRVAVALVLVLSFSLVAAVPVAAATTDLTAVIEDAIGITNATGTTLESIPATGTIYIWVHDTDQDTWSLDPWVQESVTITLKVYRGDGTRLVATKSYSAIEMTVNSPEFRTAAIAVADLGGEPGYRLLPSLTGAQEYGPATTGTPYYIRAQIEFVEGGPYDIDGTMTLQVKDDSQNADKDAAETLTVKIREAVGSWTSLTGELDETGKDTGVFEYVTTPNLVDTDIWCGLGMEMHYEDADTTLGTGDNYDGAGTEDIHAVAYVYGTSPSSVSFDPATIDLLAGNVDVVVIDRDESANPTPNDDTISGALFVESLAADDSVIDSLTVPAVLDEDVSVAGKFAVTVNFGTVTGKLDITGAAKLQATYTDPNDPSDVSTVTAAIGTTVDLYDATGTLDSSYTTIQAAIDVVTGIGWTVKVSEAYNSADETFPITIDEAGLTVESIAGAASTIIDATASGNPAIQIKAANVVLGGSDCGFTIKGTDNGVMLQSNAGCTNPTVQGNIIPSKVYGIYGDPTPIKATIKDNTIAPTTLSSLAGIWLHALGGTVIDNNDVSSHAVGISVYGGAGQDATWANPITVSNNKVYGNTYEGMCADGFYGALDHVVFSGNDCYGNGENGINVSKDVDEVKVIGNNLYNNEGAGLRVKDTVTNAAHVYVFGNNIYGNTTTVGDVTTDDYEIINYDTSNTVPADHNWWGDATGPSTGSFLGLVSYTPWLEAEVSAAAFAQNATSLDATTAVGVHVSNVDNTGNDARIGAALYTENPKATPTFTVVEDSFTDVYVVPGAIANVDEIILKFSPAGIDADCKVYAWNELHGTWEECTLQDFSSYGGYIWVKVHSELNTTAPTVPTIEALAGLPFAISVEEVRTLQSIAVTPATASIGVGGTKQFTATGTYNLAPLTEDITATVTWASSVLGVATIDAAGLATGVAEGTTNITATLGTIVSAPAVLTVEEFDVYELYDADEDGVISKSEALTAVADYFYDVITKDQALQVIVEYMG